MRTIKLLKGRERPLIRKHQWIFSGALDGDYSDLVEGELVNVASASGELLGIAYWCGGSIALKLLSDSTQKIDADFWNSALARAYAKRKSVGLVCSESTDSYRLVNAEGDRLPGLIIDIYSSVAVLQYHALGIALLQEYIVEALRKLYGDRLRAIYCKSSATLERARSSEQNFQDQYLFGQQQLPLVIRENDLRFRVDIESGQKTGFFLDQRENRAELKKFAAGKKVLNAFCYSGGFSVYALNGQAKEVTSLDSSKSAISLLDENINLNFPGAAHQAIVSDYQSFMRSCAQDFDIIVLDPPAFAKSRRNLESGKEGYIKINKQAFERIVPGGIIMTFSCSQQLSYDSFLDCLRESAHQARRRVSCLKQLHQSTCHPVNLFHPEVEYLKGCILWVE